MKQKMTKFIIFLFAMMLVVNIILALMSTFLPIKFVMPSAVVEAPHYFHFVFGKINFQLSQTVLNTWAIMILLIIILKLGTKNISVTNPSKLQVILEEYYKFIENTFLTTFGEKKKKFVPFFSALFAFILFSNLSLFLFPFILMITKENGVYHVGHFFRTPTADPNTAIGLSLVVIFLFLRLSIKRGGFVAYLKSLFEPMWFMFPINVVEIISKVLNTSMRLFGNMLAGLVIGGLL